MGGLAGPGRVETGVSFQGHIQPAVDDVLIDVDHLPARHATGKILQVSVEAVGGEGLRVPGSVAAIDRGDPALVQWSGDFDIAHVHV